VKRGGHDANPRALLTAAVLVTGLIGAAGSAAATEKPAATTPRTAAAAAAPYCGITWGSLAKSGGTLSQAPLIDVRTGRHTCYDRVVFEFNGAANGYAVHYGEAYTEARASRCRRSPRRRAARRVTAGAGQPVRHRQPCGERDRLPHLRDVVSGGSYEGYTTFAVGVRARLPYRVFVLSGPGTHSRIVLDVAHLWQ
jgi:hypothetical protein